jgi:hypothetical protein
MLLFFTSKSDKWQLAFVGYIKQYWNNKLSHRDSSLRKTIIYLLNSLIK